MAIGIEKGTPIVNRIITSDSTLYMPPIGTGNPEKVREIANILNIDPQKIDLVNPKIDEIQSDNPIEVTEKKAKAAFEVTGFPVIVEDTALSIHNVTDLFPPPLVKFWGRSPSSRQDVSNITHAKGDARATAQTTISVYDGRETQTRTGTTTGTIAKKLRGKNMFGWDDMFIPDGQKEKKTEKKTPRFVENALSFIQSIGFMKKKDKTFAEMDPEEKEEFSMRRKALDKLKQIPFAIGTYVFALTEALQMEIDAIDKEYFKGEKMEKARRHAYNLKILKGQEPNENLSVDMNKLPPYYEVQLHPDIKQYTLDPKSPDLGFLVTSYDLRKLPNGQPTRLIVNRDNRPTFMHHGEKSLKRAIAARAHEFAIHHNPKRYEEIRELKDKKTESRTNKRSPVIEAALGMLRAKPDEEILSEDEIESGDVFAVPGFISLAYPRQYSAESLSRTNAADKHIINRNGIPTSIFSLGGMPPVSGSRDQVTTAAFSFMRSYISHNSLFVDFNRRLDLFKESKQLVDDTITESENADMKDLVTRQIGVCVSGKDIPEIHSQTEQLMDAGCRSLRIYTTNPGIEVPQVAEEICKIAEARGLHNEQFPFHLCVGTIVDYEGAKVLQKIAKKHNVALTLLVGHGGGENCTSLEGGGAANAIEIMYQMSLDPEFNDVSLGFEGGLGSWFGPWMGIIDQISKNGDIVRGTVESQGGLCALHRTNEPVQPYNGTAGPTTQMIERTLFPHLAKRTNPAGQLKNNEGRPNFMKASRWAQSMAHHFTWFRSIYGRVLADQQADSMDRMMKNIEEHGFKQRIASAAAFETASSHRKVA